MSIELKKMLSSNHYDLVLVDYENDCRMMQNWFNFLPRDTPAIVLKLNHLSDATRILIPVCGGNNVAKLLWFVQQIAASLNLPVHLLHVRTTPGKVDYSQAFHNMIARSCGIYSFEEIISANITDGILNHTRENDLVVIGAPNYWQLTTQFRYSIPCKLFNSRHDTIMLIAPQPAKTVIRDVIWHELIKLDLRARNKEEAITQIVDLLIQSGQVPSEQRKQALGQIFNREEICPTDAGNETAFPHLTLDGKANVVCCLGICHEGVAFNPDNPQKVKFIFLILSAKDDYSEYLDILSQVAGIMINPKKRSELLKAGSPWEVLDILQPVNQALTQCIPSIID